jgi:hypothetical protein
VLGLVLGTIGKGKLQGALQQTVKAIEARNEGAKATDSS